MSKEIFITKRLPLYIGTKCNCKCKFCYYYSEVDNDNLSYEEIVWALEKYKANGIDSIDITGGEPTIHKDIVSIIESAVTMGFKDISLITNGIALRNEKHLSAIHDAGISNFVLSIHGHNHEIHDILTGKTGSFRDMLMTIDNMNKKNITYSINFVINKINYEYLAEFAGFVNKECTKAAAVTFLVMNPICDGSLNFNDYTVRYSDLEPYLDKSINILEKGNKKATWKFMPFCSGKDHVKQTDSIYTFCFTSYDWNYSKQVLINYGLDKYLFILYKNFSNFKINQLTKIQFKILLHFALLNEYFGATFIKTNKCNECKYFFVCDGISKNYIELFGEEEFIPIEGQKIVNPLEIKNKKIKLPFNEILLNFTFFIFSKILFRVLSILFGKQIKENYKKLNQVRIAE